MTRKIIVLIGAVFNALNVLSIVTTYISAPDSAKPSIIKVSVIFVASASAIAYLVLAYWIVRPSFTQVSQEEIARLQAGQQELQDTLQKLASEIATRSSRAAPSAPLTLKQRAASLAERLLQFLKAQGPEPPHALSAHGKSEAEQRRVFNAFFDWQRRVYYGYMADFKNEVEQIDNGLAAKGIMTGLDPGEIAPPPSSQDIDVKKIAQRLLVAAAELTD